MRERVQEARAAGRGRRGVPDDPEKIVLAKIASFTGLDRTLGERIHALVRANAPGLTPRLWYGMPAYANQEGDVVCHFQNASKFKTRYATIGFSDAANLDDGQLWPVAFALIRLSAADETRIAALIAKAAR